MKRTRPATVFVVKLYVLPGTDGIRALRAALKVLLRRFGMRALSIEEIHEDAKPGTTGKSA
jgi:hypothetical protein